MSNCDFCSSQMFSIREHCYGCDKRCCNSCFTQLNVNKVVEGFWYCRLCVLNDQNMFKNCPTCSERYNYIIMNKCEVCDRYYCQGCRNLMNHSNEYFVCDGCSKSYSGNYIDPDNPDNYINSTDSDEESENF